jgi:hypothetical protein
MLMKPNCECCDRDLPPDAENAYVCSLECTWCAECVDTFDDHACPNCRGMLQLRPTRSPAMLAKHPAVTARIVYDDCLAAR